MITLAQAMNLQAELDSHSPPARVKEAFKIIVSFLHGGCTPPSDLIQLVQSWLGRAHQQNRYGK